MHKGWTGVMMGVIFQAHPQYKKWRKLREVIKIISKNLAEKVQLRPSLRKHSVPAEMASFSLCIHSAKENICLRYEFS